jgi:hypothetical protein
VSVLLLGATVSALLAFNRFGRHGAPHPGTD